MRTTIGGVDLEMAPPTEPGRSWEGSNPSRLFAAGYAAYFHSSLQSAARAKRMTVN